MIFSPVNMSLQWRRYFWWMKYVWKKYLWTENILRAVDLISTFSNFLLLSNVSEEVVKDKMVLWYLTCTVLFSLFLHRLFTLWLGIMKANNLFVVTQMVPWPYGMLNLLPNHSRQSLHMVSCVWQLLNHRELIFNRSVLQNQILKMHLQFKEKLCHIKFC